MSTTIYVLSGNMKNIKFYLKTQFLVVKFSIYLNRRVFFRNVTATLRVN